jgi:hypothetical protein
LQCEPNPAAILNTRYRPLLDAWREQVFSSYSAPAAQLIRGTPDPTRNPLGYRIHEGTEAVLRLLILPDASRDAWLAAMDPMMRTQAVRGQSASEAIGFVFLLKRAIRAVFGGSLDAAARDALDQRVDELALVAFDAYSRCRDDIQEIRVRAMRRRVATIYDRLGMDPGSPDEAEPVAGGAPVPVFMEVKA